MTDSVNALLDRFVEGFRPASHQAAGIQPTHFDLSLTANEIKALGEGLLRDYDAMREAEAAAVQAEALQALREERDAALEQVEKRQARISELVTELKAAREAATSTPPVAPEPAAPTTPEAV